MRGLSEVTIAGHKFVVRELTYPQILDLLKEIEEATGEQSGIDRLYGSTYMPESVIAKIIDDDLGKVMLENDLAPSEVEPLFKKAVEVNHFLAKALKEWQEMSRLMMRSDLLSLATNLNTVSEGRQFSSKGKDTSDRNDTASPILSKQ